MFGQWSSTSGLRAKSVQIYHPIRPETGFPNKYQIVKLYKYKVVCQEKFSMSQLPNLISDSSTTITKTIT